MLDQLLLGVYISFMFQFTCIHITYTQLLGYVRTYVLRIKRQIHHSNVHEYWNFQPVSARLQGERLQFVGHCVHMHNYTHNQCASWSCGSLKHRADAAWRLNKLTQTPEGCSMKTHHPYEVWAYALPRCSHFLQCPVTSQTPPPVSAQVGRDLLHMPGVQHHRHPASVGHKLWHSGQRDRELVNSSL